MEEKKKLFSLVVPLYNEEDVLNESYKRIKATLENMHGYDYEIIMINDGSRDNTLKLAKNICVLDRKVKLLSFSRNFGHQVAITAGLDFAKGDFIGFIDADLQDPPELLGEMVRLLDFDGNDVVYGTRTKRDGETFFKKITSKVYYRVLNFFSDIDIPLDTGDFRVITKQVADVLRGMKEKDRFIRGLVSWVGFKQTSVLFERDKRFAGETKYSLKKMIELSLNGIYSFSSNPLKLAQILGFCLFCIGIVTSLIGVIFKALSIQNNSSGLLVLFLGSFNLLCLGIIGEYVGRIYNEVKGRPLYIIKEFINFDKEA